MNARNDSEILKQTTIHIFNELHVFRVVECNNINSFVSDFDASEFLFCHLSTK